MRGRSKNQRRLSFSTNFVLPKKLFGPNFYQKIWPLSLFSDYFRFNGKFRFHGTILTRPMTQFKSLAITSKSNQAESLQSLGRNFRKKSDPLKKPVSWTVFRAFFKEKKGKIRVMSGKNELLEKRRLEGTRGKFCDFISEKGCLEGTSEIFEKNKVQREKWPVPSNAPCNSITNLGSCYKKFLLQSQRIFFPMK